jgi:hypothetical protein
VFSASYCGFALFFEGSGSFNVEFFLPRRHVDSSTGSELIMATWAGKSIISFQILERELGLVRSEPTPLELDASAVTDGAGMDRVSRLQRFQAARLGMLRQWVADRILRLIKTHTRDMRADILTKPVNPMSEFAPKQSLLLCGYRVRHRCPSATREFLPAQPVVDPRGGAQEVGCLPILFPQGFMGEEGEWVSGSSRDSNPR